MITQKGLLKTLLHCNYVLWYSFSTKALFSSYYGSLMMTQKGFVKDIAALYVLWYSFSIKPPFSLYIIVFILLMWCWNVICIVSTDTHYIGNLHNIFRSDIVWLLTWINYFDVNMHTFCFILNLISQTVRLILMPWLPILEKLQTII